MPRIVADRPGSRYGGVREAPAPRGGAESAASREVTGIRILHLALPVMLGCAAATPGIIGPDPDPQGGIPIGRSVHMRPAEFTYRLGDMEQQGEEVRIDFHLSNGTHRSYHTVMLRAVVFGGAGEIHGVRLPVGGMLAGQTRPLVARVEGVTFPARDVTFELIYALP